MARLLRRNFYVLCFCFVQLFYCAVLASHSDSVNPSIHSTNLLDVDDSYIQNQNLHRTVNHVQKRSPVYPAKKASASLEKKTNLKDLSVHLEKVKAELSNVTGDNSTFTYNSTDSSVKDNDKYHITASVPPDVSNSNDKNNITASVFPEVSNADDKSHNSVTVPPGVSNATISVSSTVSTSAVTASPSPTTSIEDLLPTQPANITNTTVDHHIYYNSKIYLEREKALQFWVDFDALPQDRVVVNEILSHSHRRAATVTLSFDFPFYGHPLRNITIATGGFVYMGDYMHSWLAATQYIAPLMANFDTSLSPNSTVRYFDNGTAFVIEWHEVALQDKMKGGNFTFQATLLKNGNIVFVYKDIPLSVTQIGDVAHPVKVGLSDAYVIEKVIYFIRRKTIYEYHRINMKKDEIGNDTAIYFTALTTCLTFHNCSSCMAADVGLNCVWCEPAKRCSDGLDRLRQDWLQAKCDVERSSVNCSALPAPDVNPYVQPLTDTPSKSYTLSPHFPQPDYPHQTTAVPNMPDKNRHNSDDGASSSARVAEDASSMTVGSVVAILVILAIVMGGLVWVGYAYKNPHTSSGQLLIRYRPSQWRFRSGEARYTAASVHM